MTREERGLLYRLAGRHSDIGFIRAYMLREYGRAPSRDQIERARADVLQTNQRTANSHTRSFSAANQAEYARRYALGRDIRGGIAQ